MKHPPRFNPGNQLRKTDIFNMIVRIYRKLDFLSFETACWAVDHNVLIVRNLSYTQLINDLDSAISAIKS